MKSDFWGGYAKNPSEASVSTPSLIPSNLNVSSANIDIIVNWDTVTDAASYNLYWSTSSGVSKGSYEGVITGITETSYTHTGRTIDTTYYYVITGVNGSIESNTSSEVSVTSRDVSEGMVLVNGGCFQMGDTFGTGYSDEIPVHEVCLDDFYIGEHEVTQGEWKAVMGSNPSYFSSCGDNCPVGFVSWNDVQDFITAYNQQTGETFRLPTEAEWEYAARAGGQNLKYAGTSSDSELGDYAWYYSNSGSTTHPVKTKNPNALGLYDMSGNVWEWVQDWYSNTYYSSSPVNNPTGPNSWFARVYRGGSCGSDARDTRAANRNVSLPSYNNFCLGFRLARTP